MIEVSSVLIPENLILNQVREMVGYIGFEIANEAGYGLDFNGHYRNLPHIGGAYSEGSAISHSA